MNWDVNFILIWDFLEAFIKVFHIFNQETSWKSEISFFIFAIINHMNHYAISKVCSLDILKQTAHLARGIWVFVSVILVSDIIALRLAVDWSNVIVYRHYLII